jgi:hypothetical protein
MVSALLQKKYVRSPAAGYTPNAAISDLRTLADTLND